MSQKYDIIIIGSGPAGLTSGLILAKHGYKVLILEKHYVAGGGLHNFVRKGVPFDTGVHYAGCLDKGQTLNQLYKYLGVLPMIHLQQLDKDCFDLISFGGKEFKLAQGFDNFIHTLCTSFPAEEKAIRQYVKDICEITEEEDIYHLRVPKEKTNPFNDKIRISFTDYLDQLTKNTDLKMVLASFNVLYSGKQESASLFTHAFISHHLIQGAFRFKNGSQELADALVTNFKKQGGEILLNKKVSGFEYSGKDISAVLTADGSRYEGKNIISTTHPAITLDMIESHRLRKVYRNRIKSIENTGSSFGIYIKLKEKTLPYFNYNIHHYRQNSTWGVDIYKEEGYPSGYFTSSGESPEHPGYAESLLALTSMDYSEVKKWENTQVNKRGQDYLDFKTVKAEQLLDLMEERFPALRSKIDGLYTSSPLTLRDYLGAVEGGMYGLRQDYRNPAKSFLPMRTHIPNLMFLGQNNNLHGLMGTTMTAIMGSGQFVDINQLIRDIKNA